MRTRRLTAWGAATLAVAAPPLVVFVFPTVALVARNAEYFPGGYRTGWPLYAAAAISLAVGAALAVTARRPAARFLAALYLLSAPAWFVHALALRATGSVAAPAAVAAAWLAAAALAARAPRDALLQYCGIAGAALLVGSGVPAIAAAQAAEAEKAQVAPGDVGGGTDQSSDLPNIYHLVFDEYQTDFFEHLLDDDLRRDLRGFAFFPDTTTTYGRTEMSFASMFASGDYDYSVPLEQQVARAFSSPDSTLRRLGELGYHRTGYLHRAHQLGGDPPLDEWVLHDELAEGGGAIGGEDLILSLWVYAHAPEALSRGLLPDHHYTQLSAGAFLPDDAPPRSVASMRTLIRRERSLADRGRYTFAHLILPHFPNVLEPDCRYVPGAKTGPIQQAACTNLLIRELVRTLRDLGRLDDSIVIIQSDHGSWYDIVDGRVRSVRGDGLFSEDASSARARALLLVHLPSGAVGGDDTLEVIDRPTALEDLMPTVFAALGVAHDFTGNRVPLTRDVPPDRPRFYHFYDKGGDGSMTAGPIVRYRIEGGRAVRERDIDVPEPPRG